MPALKVKNLNVHTAQNTLVQGVNFTIENGQTLALMGASGSGKSITAMALMDALPPSLHYTAEQINFAGAKPALIMQNPGDCFDPLFKIEHAFLEMLKGPRSEVRAYMFELLAEVGLEASAAKCYPFELSGGMLHKVMIALAIAKVQNGGASCIIADEPITGLDCASKALLLQHIKILQKKYGFALLYIDHDLSAARLMADNLAIMQNGQIVEHGKMQEVINNPQHAYTKELINEHVNTISTPIISTNNAECILSCKNIQKSYKNKTVLQNADLELNRGESLGIVGNNGAGKSTLLKIILGLEKQDSGTVHILNKDIATLNSTDRSWRKAIQAVFQHARMAVNPRLCVHDILMEPLRAHKINTNEAAQVEELLTMVKLPARYARAYPQQMSGGQLQRLCIARALALKPDILLLDEPLTDLDAVVAESILHMLDDIKKELNITLLYISHDIRSILRLCERVLVLHEGHFVDDFKSHEYQSPERHNAFTTFMKHSLLKF